MNYIPYPRLDKDNHPSLNEWRKNQNDSNWRRLKDYLIECPKISNANDLPKCWFSELPQGDHYALDIEHFRPKQSGSPLSLRQIKELQKIWGIQIKQSDKSCAYEWLENDYRNYRLATAMVNRAGGKHIYFPIVAGSQHLQKGTFPWNTQEFPYFLDPADKHDAQLLFVKPDGQIAPIAPKTVLQDKDFEDLPKSWKQDGFNFVRAAITILVFNLNDKIFVMGRKKVYSETTNLFRMVELILLENPHSDVLPELLKNLIARLWPSAPFSLAAKSALIAYQGNNGDSAHITRLHNIRVKILKKLEEEVDKIKVDWNRP
jgi:hypothetical protein